MAPIIAPSILSADFANLEREVKMLNDSEADWIHVDVMDGVFVQNISLGIPVVEAIHRHAKKPLDVHLMIVHPEKYLDAFSKAGAERISIHIETCPHIHRDIQYIKSLGCKASVAINPHTPVSELENIIRDIDMVCVMSVNPGFGAQKFIENTYQKIRQLKALLKASGSEALIEIDGGVNVQNVKPLMDAGADAFAAGSFVFSDSDPKNVIARLKAIR